MKRISKIFLSLFAFGFLFVASSCNFTGGNNQSQNPPAIPGGGDKWEEITPEENERVHITYYGYDNFWIVAQDYQKGEASYEIDIESTGYTFPEGHTFIGWYTENGQPYAFGNAVIEDISLYAKFDVNTYTITYNYEGRKWAEQVRYGEVVNLPEIEYTTEFLYWASEDQSIVLREEPYHFERDIEVYALYTVGISFACPTGDYPTIYFTAGAGESYVEFPEVADTDSAKFVGWFDDFGNQLTSGDYSHLKQFIGLHAEFKSYMFNVDLVVDGITTESLQIEYGGIYYFNEPYKEGYIFDGWYYQGNNLGISGTFIYDHDVVLNAVFVENNFNVYLDAAGGYLQSNVVSAKYNEFVSLPTPDKVGYEFEGWKYNNEIVSMDYYYLHKENINLVASWQNKTYTVYLDFNGGTYDNQTILQNGFTYAYYDMTTNLKDPTKEGFVFDGWYFEDNSKFDPSTAYTYDNDINLIAKWTDKYLISFDTGIEGYEIDSIGMSQYKETHNLPSLTYENRIFVGWSKIENDFDNIFNEQSYYNYSVTLHALWHYTYDGLVFEYYQNETYASYDVVEYIGFASEVTIPDEYNGIPVRRIRGNAFKDNYSIKVIRLPKYLVDLGDFYNAAIYNCGNLEEIYFHEDTIFGDSVSGGIENCPNLQIVEIPSNFMAVNILNSNSDFTINQINIRYKENEPFAALLYLQEDVNIKLVGDWPTISKELFEYHGDDFENTDNYMKYVNNIILACNSDAIETDAFVKAVNLKSVIIEDSCLISTIKDNAISNIENLRLSINIQTIGTLDITDTNVYYPSSETMFNKINSSTNFNNVLFDQCFAIDYHSVYEFYQYNENKIVVTKVDDYESIMLDMAYDLNNYIVIGLYGDNFPELHNILTISLPSTLEFIVDGQGFDGIIEIFNYSSVDVTSCFSKYSIISNAMTNSIIQHTNRFSYYEDENMSYLVKWHEKEKEVYLPDYISNKPYVILEKAFDSIKKIQHIHFGEGVVKLDSKAFNHLYNVYSITIPNTVIEMEKDSFAKCYRLYEVYNLSSLDIDLTYFENAKIIHEDESEVSRFYENSTFRYYYDLENERFIINDYIFDSISPSHRQIVLDSTIFNEELELSLPVIVGEYAFYNNLEMYWVYTGKVTYIGAHAFEGCDNLSPIYLDANYLTYVGENAIDLKVYRASVYLSCGENEIPSTWDENWLGRHSKITYDKEMGLN